MQCSSIRIYRNSSNTVYRSMYVCTTVVLCCLPHPNKRMNKLCKERRNAGAHERSFSADADKNSSEKFTIYTDRCKKGSFTLVPVPLSCHPGFLCSNIASGRRNRRVLAVFRTKVDLWISRCLIVSPTLESFSPAKVTQYNQVG